MKSIAVLVLLLVSSSNLIHARTLSITPILVNEGDTVRACVTYTSAPESVTEIVLSTLDGGAGGAISTTTGGSDFTSFVETLTFGLGMDLEQCRNIQTLADEALEGFESFRIEAFLSGTTTPTDMSPQTATIGNVGILTIGFGETSYQFLEDQGGQVCVVIEGNGSIEGTLMVTLMVTLTDGTATEADRDYDPSLRSMVIVLDQNTPASGRCFSVPITSDQSVELDETFHLTINSNRQYQLSPTNGQVVVTIINDDVECGDLPIPSNGAVSYSDTTLINSVATFTCSEGYIVTGDSTRTCLVTGMWSGIQPSCEPVDCPSLSDPLNGQVHLTTTTLSSIASYSCDQGFAPSSTEDRLCQTTGQWSGLLPVCTIIDCGTPSSLNNGGQVTVSLTTFGSFSVYTCPSGYVLSAPPSIRSCMENGNWSGLDPTCDSADNVGLYVGIAVPVGLVIIAATVLLLCVIHKKRTKLSEVVTYQANSEYYEDINVAPIISSSTEVPSTQEPLYTTIEESTDSNSNLTQSKAYGNVVTTSDYGNEGVVGINEVTMETNESYGTTEQPQMAQLTYDYITNPSPVSHGPPIILNPAYGDVTTTKDNDIATDANGLSRTAEEAMIINEAYAEVRQSIDMYIPTTENEAYTSVTADTKS